MSSNHESDPTKAYMGGLKNGGGRKKSLVRVRYVCKNLFSPRRSCLEKIEVVVLDLSAFPTRKKALQGFFLGGGEAGSLEALPEPSHPKIFFYLRHHDTTRDDFSRRNIPPLSAGIPGEASKIMT